MKNLLLTLLSCIVIPMYCDAQSIDSLLWNLWEPKDVVIENFKKWDFEVIEKTSNEFCSTVKMKNEDKTLTLNFCTEYSDSLTDFIIQYRDEDHYNKFYSELNQLPDYKKEMESIAEYTAYVYSDSYDYEVILVNMTDVKVYPLVVSCYRRFDEFKEIVESGIKYDKETDPVYLFHKLATTTNSKGQSLESELASVFQAPDMPDSTFFNAADQFRSGDTYEQMKKIVDEQFLNDQDYRTEVFKGLINLRFASQDGEWMEESKQKLMAQRMMDNNLYGSLIMVKYVLDGLKKYIK